MFTNRPPSLTGAVERSETGGYFGLQKHKRIPPSAYGCHLPLGKGGYDGYRFTPTNPDFSA